MWGPTADKGMVTFSVMPAIHGPQLEQAMASLHQVMDGLKAKGWKEDKKVINGGSCSTLTPPPSDKDAPVMTGCMAEAKGMAISISYMGKHTLPVENVKTLLDKLVSRLP
jgi:hypothetical protein